MQVQPANDSSWCQLDDPGLRWCAVHLCHAQVLHLSRFRHPQGLPSPLLQAVAAMTDLRQLFLAGCSPEAGQTATSAAATTVTAAAAPSEQLASPSTQKVVSHRHVNAGQQQQQPTSQLWFLQKLCNLEDLDLSGWRHGTMGSLAGLSGLSQLTRLKLQR